MPKRLKCKFIVCRADEDTAEMSIKFDCADGTYFFEELSLHDFKGDAPDQIADSLQHWVDHLRTVGKTEKDGEDANGGCPESLDRLKVYGDPVYHGRAYETP